MTATTTSGGRGVALVTGAGRGIGRAIAARLARDGYSVVANDVSGDTVAETVEQIRSEGGSALSFPGDVTRESEVRAMLAASKKAFGNLTLLVNNAGVDFSGTPAETTREQWSRLHDVDLWAPMMLVREAQSQLAACVAAGGFASVVNIASNHAIATMPGRAAYAAAKAGVVGLTRALALDLGPDGIRVNAVLPGYIETPIWDLWLKKAHNRAALLAEIASRHPLRRYGTPDDVAGVVVFLAGPDSAFITGSTVVVDGGYSVVLEPTAQ